MQKDPQGHSFHLTELGSLDLEINLPNKDVSFQKIAQSVTFIYVLVKRPHIFIHYDIIYSYDHYHYPYYQLSPKIALIPTKMTIVPIPQFSLNIRSSDIQPLPQPLETKT